MNYNLILALNFPKVLERTHKKVGFEVIGAKDLAIVFKRKGAVRLGHSEDFGRGLVGVCGVGIGVAGANDFLKNAPYGWPIAA